MDPKLSVALQRHQITHINRTGEQPYRLLINLEGDILRTKLGGSWVFRDAALFWKRVLDESRNSGVERALVMFQLSEQMPVKEACMLASRAAELFSGAGIRLAVVDLNGRSFGNPGFWQMSAANEQFSAFFQNMAEAELWLEAAD